MAHDVEEEQDAFELLDEREPSAGKSLAWRRLDLLFGLLLLAGIAGWAGSDWWQKQEAASNYHAGERYAAAHDWDAASSAFLAAGDFGQAKARASDASSKIAERDTAYAAAVAEMNAGNWADSLRDFRSMQAIQPGFRDSAPSERQVEQHVYSLALDGTIAVRSPDPPGASPPGLYLYKDDAWNYLPGSDLSSRVRSESSFACVVYDTPPASRPGRASVLSDRALSVAQYGGDALITHALALDPGEFARFTCDDSGVTGESYAANSGGYLDVRLAYTRGIPLYPRAFEGYDSEAIIRIPSPGPAWAILSSNSRQRLVVGDYTGAFGNSRNIKLYISDARGELSLVAERPALVEAAWLSPDSRFLVADEFLPVGNGPEEHRLVLLHLPPRGSSDSRGQRVPAEVLMSTGRRDQQVVGNAWYDAAFIESGPFAGKLLIERRTYPDGELRLIDPNEPGKTIWSTDQIDFVAPLEVFSLSGGILLTFNSQASSTLPVLFVAANGKTTRLALPIEFSDTLSAAQEINDRLVYSLRNRGLGNTDVVSRVFSTALPGAAASGSPPVMLVSSVDVEADGERVTGLNSTSGQGWSFGSGLLAYIRQGQLEAKTYDATVSLPLEVQILKLYPLRVSP